MVHLGRFGWHDLMSVDQEASSKFYAELFGWELDSKPQADRYRRLLAEGTGFGGIVPWDPDSPNVTYWTGYLMTDNLPETVAIARAAGGTVPFDRMESPGAGAFAVIIDPTGGETVVIENLPGGEWHTFGTGGWGDTVLWNELITSDLATTIRFYRRVFGWDCSDNVSESGYVVPRRHGIPVAGFFQPPTAIDRSGWITYFGTDNIEASVRLAKQLGGTVAHDIVHTPGVGRTAWILDPHNAIFGLMEPEEGWFDRLP